MRPVPTAAPCVDDNGGGPTRPSGIIGVALVAQPSPLFSPKSTRTCEFDRVVFAAKSEYVEFDLLEI